MVNQQKLLRDRVTNSHLRRGYYASLSLVLALLYLWAYPLYPIDKDSKNIRYLVATANALTVAALGAMAFKKPQIIIDSQNLEQ